MDLRSGNLDLLVLHAPWAPVEGRGGVSIGAVGTKPQAEAITRKFGSAGSSRRLTALRFELAAEHLDLGDQEPNAGIAPDAEALAE